MWVKPYLCTILYGKNHIIFRPKIEFKIIFSKSIDSREKRQVLKKKQSIDLESYSDSFVFLKVTVKLCRMYFWVSYLLFK